MKHDNKVTILDEGTDEFEQVMNTIPDLKLVRLTDVARKMGLDPRTVKKMAYERGINTIRLHKRGNHYLRKQDVSLFVERLKI